MTASRKRKKLSRTQKIWLSIGLSILGTVLLVGIGVLVQGARDTDLADPHAGLTASFRGDVDVDAPPIRFTDVAKEMGIAMRHGPSKRGRNLIEDTGSGLAWGDYDDDGDFDLYCVNLGSQGLSGIKDNGNRLYRNDGPRFTDVTNEAGVGDELGLGMGASFADYDGDGDLDLYVTNAGPNRLYRNKGDGTFEEVGQAAGVADPSWSTGVTWGDYDRDGHVDLYVCNYLDYDTGDAGTTIAVGTATGSYSVPFTLNPNGFDAQPNRLYRNRGDGTFEDVAEALRVEDEEGRSLGATFCDLDGDGWLDLYVNNDVSSNRLFLNRGERKGRPGVSFRDVGASTGTADPRGSMGLSLAEMGAMAGMADDLPDLFIAHWVAQENAFYLSVMSKRGNLEYRDKTRRFRLGENSLDRVGWGSALLDLDRDGRLDLAVANGSTLEVKGDQSRLLPEPLFLLWNAGKNFVDVTSKAGAALARSHCARGLAAADYDGDGDVDLAVLVNRGQPLLLRNDTETRNRSLSLRLKGPAARVLGARVTLIVGGEKQVRWWGADVSFCSQHAAEMLFGLGEATGAERLHIRWADGRQTVLEAADLTAGRVDVAYPGK